MIFTSVNIMDTQAIETRINGVAPSVKPLMISCSNLSLGSVRTCAGARGLNGVRSSPAMT